MRLSGQDRILVLLWVTVAAVVPCFGQWQGTSGPSGGEVTAIVIHPRDPSIVYAVAAQPYSGVLKSSDGGEFWEILAHGLEFDAVADRRRWPHRLILDEMQPETLFVVIKTASYYDAGALYRSNDGGASWAIVNDMQVHGLCVRGGLVFALGKSGLRFSADAGDSWVVRNNKMLGDEILWDDQGILWVSGEQGLFRSPDSGKTHHLFAFEDLWKVQSFDVATVQQEKVVAVGVLGYGPGHDRLYLSRDEGETWLDRSATLPYKSSLDRYSIPWAIRISRHHPDHMSAGLTEGFFRTIDGGEHWAEQNTGLAMPHFRVPYITTIVTALATSAQQPDLILVGTSNDGIYRSRDAGKTWQFASAPSGNLVSLAAAENAGKIIAASSGGIYSLEGGTWTPTTMLIGQLMSSVMQVAISPHNPQLLLCSVHDASESKYTFKSTDAGKTWQAGIANWGGNWVFDPVDTNLIFMTSGRVSRDQGDSWQPLPIPASPSFPTDLAVHPTDNKILYLLRRDGSIDRSLDQGATWSQIRAGMDSNQTIIRIDPRQPSTLYLGGTRLYRSEDAGQSWTYLPFHDDISGIVCCSHNQEFFIATLREGVWRSADAGNSFTKMDGLPSDRIVALAFAVQQQRKKLFAGTQGAGVYQCDLGPVLAAKDEPRIPFRYVSAQNYPNPFNTGTTIRYSLPRAGLAELAIYNTRGEEVYAFPATHQLEGRHEARWEGKDQAGSQVASGVYVYHLKMGGQVQVRKMVLVH